MSLQLVNSQVKQGGRAINMSVPANQTLRVQSSGTKAYLIVATLTVNLRPENGDFTAYTQGTGFDTGDVVFNTIEIQNPNALPVVISIWVGFAGFIDNRLILSNQSNPSVALPTYSVASSATNVPINDISGSGFTDINGVKWLALYRVAILVFNLDGGVTLLLQKAGGIGTSPAIGAIFPLTPIRFDVSGNYVLNNGGGNVNALVSEIYSAIPA